MTSYIYDMVDTWNAGATTFTAVKMNVTDTASASGSLLMDLQVGGSSRFNVSKTGSLKLGVNPTGTNQAGTNVIIAGSQGTGTGAGGSIVFQVAPAGTISGGAVNALATALTIGADRNATFGGNIVVAGGAVTRPFSSGSGSTTLNILSTHVGLSGFIEGSNNVATFGFGNSTNTHNGLFVTQSGYFGWYAFDNTAPDLRLYRDDANKLALRNGANAQFLRVYSTYTDASNYERGAINTGADFVELAAETAGTGDDNLDVRLTPAGTGNVRFGTHTGTADTAVSGYIEIKDAGGTIRKLAVIS